MKMKIHVTDRHHFTQDVQNYILSTLTTRWVVCTAGKLVCYVMDSRHQQAQRQHRDLKTHFKTYFGKKIVYGPKRLSAYVNRPTIK